MGWRSKWRGTHHITASGPLNGDYLDRLDIVGNEIELAFVDLVGVIAKRRVSMTEWTPFDFLHPFLYTSVHGTEGERGGSKLSEASACIGRSDEHGRSCFFRGHYSALT